jgi:inositol polyphosphate 5-phosphatase INPP5B/F
VPWIWTSRSSSESADSRPPQDLSQQDGLPEPASTDPPLARASSDDEPKSTNTDIPDSSSVDTSTATSFGVQSSKDTLAHSSPPSSIFPDNDADLPDIFVLGFQELDLSTEALFYSTSTFKADSWISSIFAALGKSADNYIKVCHRPTSMCLRLCILILHRSIQLASKQLVGVLVVVVIRKELQSMVKEVSTGSAGVGLMGIMVSFIC